jgi:hypothetical protein
MQSSCIILLLILVFIFNSSSIRESFGTYELFNTDDQITPDINDPILTNKNFGTTGCSDGRDIINCPENTYMSSNCSHSPCCRNKTSGDCWHDTDSENKYPGSTCSLIAPVLEKDSQGNISMYSRCWSDESCQAEYDKGSFWKGNLCKGGGFTNSGEVVNRDYCINYDCYAITGDDTFYKGEGIVNDEEGVWKTCDIPGGGGYKGKCGYVSTNAEYEEAVAQDKKVQSKNWLNLILGFLVPSTQGKE